MPAKKLPALMLYGGDWFKDMNLQSCPLEVRGAWFELLLFMNEAEERGKLVIGGKKMTSKDIANVLKVSEQTASKTIRVLLAKRVASVEQKTGKIYSRRIVRTKQAKSFGAFAAIALFAFAVTA